MTQEKRPITLITGASSGIGAALAHEFAAYGHELVLIARREQTLGTLADAIAATGRARPAVLRADLARLDAAQTIVAALDERGLEPDVVVNNAGFGLVSAADQLDRAEQLAMIDLDVRALTDLSLVFLDSLKRRRGGILNVASIAAFMPGPGMAVYYASKAYVLSFSEALHSGHRALPWPGADRVSGARRHERRRFSAASHAFRRAGGERWLPRPDARPPRSRSGPRQPSGDDDDPLCPAQPLCSSLSLASSEAAVRARRRVGRSRPRIRACARMSARQACSPRLRARGNARLHGGGVLSILKNRLERVLRFHRKSSQ